MSKKGKHPKRAGLEAKSIPVKPVSNYEVGYKKPPKHAQWTKGQSGNPLGGQAHNKELKEIKTLTNQQLIEVANLVIQGDVNELRALKDDDTEIVLKRMLASVAIKIISKGDMGALDVLLNRLVGKVKDQLDLGGGLTHSVAQVVITLPSNGRELQTKSA